MATHTKTVRQQFEASSSDDLSRQQLKVNALHPRHMVSYTYPAFDLITEEEQADMGVVLLPPANAAYRFEPKPLLPSTAVIAHSGWEDPASSKFFTLTPATTYQTTPGSLSFLDRPKTEGFAGFKETMKYFAKHIGRTSLHATLLRRKGDNQATFFRIKAGAIWYQRDPAASNYLHHGAIWTFPLSDFGAMQRAVYKPAWWYALDDLLNRRSDLAARHVSHFMKQSSVPDPTSTLWKKPREIDYTIHIAQVTPLPEPVECAICLVESNEMVTLPCGDGKHVFHSECITAWCKEKMPNLAGCPCCRQPVIGIQTTEDLSLGLIDGVYQYDNRYSHWENVQRAAGDLESRLASNVHESIPGGMDRMLSYWDAVMASARMEPSSSTPYHLQVVRFPEFELVRPSLRRAMSSMPPGVVLSMSAVASFLLKRVLKDLDWEIEIAGSDNFFDKRLTPRTFILRPSMEPFIRRSISQMLMAALVRRCNNKEHRIGQHAHGARGYYRVE